MMALKVLVEEWMAAKEFPPVVAVKAVSEKESLSEKDMVKLWGKV